MVCECGHVQGAHYDSGGPCLDCVVLGSCVEFEPVAGLWVEMRVFE